MNSAAHSVAPEVVMAYLDGELSVAEAQAVSAHLAQCAECAKLAEQFQVTSQFLSRWTVPATPPSLENAINEMAADLGSARKAARPNPRIPSGSWNWKAWTIASGGAVAAVWLLFTLTLPELYRSKKVAMQASGVRNEDVSDVISDSHGTLGKSKSRIVAQLSVPPQVASSPTPAPMIARTVSLSITVKDFAASRASLDMILARHRGYSAQLNVSTPEDAARSFRASLRIPAPELASAVEDLKKLGHVENESQSGEEVTQQHADLAARLKTARGTEERMRAILQQRTGKISDVLEVEEEIARVRGEIERMEAEQKALEHRVDFASVELRLTEEYKAELNSPSGSSSTRIHNAFVAGYRNAQETLLGVLLFFGEEGPSLLIWLVILGLPVILIWRRYRRLQSRV